MSEISLAADVVGTGPQRVVFLHGLFGRGRNFAGPAKALNAGGERFRSLLVDLPDHGASDWTEAFSYPGIADAVARLIREQPLADGAPFAAEGTVDVVGHSMGGKVAMQLALRHPDLVRRLVVVDIAPVAAAGGRGNFEHLLDSLAALDLDGLGSRGQADAELAERIPEAGTRGFLLQNLRRESGRFVWQPNLALLRKSLPEIMGWPGTDAQFDGPVLWIAGGDSDYVRDEDLPAMRALFPRVRRVVVKGSGHWVHSQKPLEFQQILDAFLA